MPCGHALSFKIFRLRFMHFGPDSDLSYECNAVRDRHKYIDRLENKIFHAFL